MALQVELVSPEASLYTAEADMVIARTTDGEIAFQPGHIPFVGVLVAGRVKINLTGGGTQIVAVHRGFVEISDDHVAILSDVAELAEAIDVPRAQAARERAVEALRTDPDNERMADALRRAEVRLEVTGAGATTSH